VKEGGGEEGERVKERALGLATMPQPSTLRLILGPVRNPVLCYRGACFP
jgi:hypothetical protein